MQFLIAESVVFTDQQCAFVTWCRTVISNYIEGNYIEIQKRLFRFLTTDANELLANSGTAVHCPSQIINA